MAPAADFLFFAKGYAESLCTKSTGLWERVLVCPHHQMVNSSTEQPHCLSEREPTWAQVSWSPNKDYAEDRKPK